MYFIILSFLLSSCASTINFTEAESYGEGVISLEPSAELNITRVNDFFDESLNIPFGSLKLGIGYGVTEDLDCKVNINSSLFTNFGIKYQMANNENLASAVGFRLQSNLLGLINSEVIDPKDYLQVFAPAVDLHFSNKLSKNSRFLINPTFSFIPSSYYNISPNSPFGANLSMAIVKILENNNRFKFGGSVGYVGSLTFGLGCSFDIRM